MLRSMSGFKSQYHNLTIMAISEFNEWRVLVHGPGVVIHGARQFTEEKAKEHALAVAQRYLAEHRQENVSEIPPPEWVATQGDDWLVWTG